jgi:hypothetical protein
VTIVDHAGGIYESFSTFLTARTEKLERNIIGGAAKRAEFARKAARIRYQKFIIYYQAAWRRNTSQDSNGVTDELLI